MFLWFLVYKENKGIYKWITKMNRRSFIKCLLGLLVMPKSAPVFGYKMNKPKRLNRRESSYHRGYGGKRWEITRHRIFVRDKYICRDCGDLTILNCRDASRRPHCDHIIPKPNGSDRDENLQTLCGRCHSVKSMRERML